MIAKEVIRAAESDLWFTKCRVESFFTLQKFISFNKQLLCDKTVCYDTYNIFPLMTATFFALNAQMLKQELICNFHLHFTLNKDGEVTGN